MCTLLLKRTENLRDELASAKDSTCFAVVLVQHYLQYGICCRSIVVVAALVSPGKAGTSIG